MKTSFLFFVLLLITFGCSKETAPETVSTIEITADKKSLRFCQIQQYDTLPVNSFGIIAVKHRRESNLFKLAISKPTNVLFGFNEFRVLPNSVSGFNYKVNKFTKFEFSDSIAGLKGKIFLLNKSGEIPYLNLSFANEIDKEIRQEKSAAVLYGKILKQSLSEVGKRTDIALRNLSEKEKKELKDYLVGYYFKRHLVNYEIQGNTLTNAQENLLLEIYQKISFWGNEHKDYAYWFLQSQLAKNHLANEKNFGALIKKLQHFEPSVREYILFHLHPVYKFQNPEKYIRSPFLLKEIKDYSDIRFSSTDYVYDINSRKISLKDIFLETKQDSLLLDFSGSWCSPCLKEIDCYSKEKNKNSGVRVVFIFFENNIEDGKKLARKKKLDLRNCYFLATSESSTVSQTFTKKYNWMGEFPHHFLFNKNGMILNPDVKSLNIESNEK